MVSMTAADSSDFGAADWVVWLATREDSTAMMSGTALLVAAAGASCGSFSVEASVDVPVPLSDLGSANHLATTKSTDPGSSHRCPGHDLVTQVVGIISNQKLLNTHQVAPDLVATCIVPRSSCTWLALGASIWAARCRQSPCPAGTI